MDPDQQANQPRHSGVGRQRPDAAGPEGVVRQRDGQVDEHGDGPGPSAAHRSDQAPHADGSHRQGGQHHEGPQQAGTPRPETVGQTQEGQAVRTDHGGTGPGGPPAQPPRPNQVGRVGRQGLETSYCGETVAEQCTRPEAEDSRRDHEGQAAGPQQHRPQTVEAELSRRPVVGPGEGPAGHHPSEGPVRHLQARQVGLNSWFRSG